MEITVNEDQQIQIERVFNGVKFVTINGEELSVCMRDTGYELVYEGTPIELKNGVVNESQSARIRELEEALEFYAKGENWRSPSKGFALQYDPVPSAISKDSGHIAKQALNKTEQSDGSVIRREG